MGYRIKRYYVKKEGRKCFTVWAEIYRTNIFGCIIDISQERLDGNYKARHGHRSLFHFNFFQVPKSSRKDAELIAKTLNGVK